MKIDLQAFLDLQIEVVQIPHDADEAADMVRAAILEAIRAEDFQLTGWTTEP